MSTATDEMEATRIKDAIYLPPAPPRPTAVGTKTRAPRRRRALSLEAAQQLMNDASRYDADLASGGRRG